MTTFIIVALIVLLAGLIIFFALRFRGTRTVIVVQNFNHSDTDRTVTTADAAATAGAQKPNGEMLAGARVDGNGVATANAEIGHEFTYTGRQRRDFEVSVEFEWKDRLEVTQEPANTRGIVNAILVPNSPNFANDTRTTAGVTENPAGGGSKQEIHVFSLTLNPNQSFTVLVEVSARAESTDPLAAAACSSQVEAKVKRIILRPV